MPALLRSASLTGYAELAREAGLDPIALLCSRWGCRCPACAGRTEELSADAVSRATRAVGAAAAATKHSGCAWPNRAGCRTSVRSACWCARSRPCGGPRGTAALHPPAQLRTDPEDRGGRRGRVDPQELVVGRAAGYGNRPNLLSACCSVCSRSFSARIGGRGYVCFAHSAPKDRTVHRRVFGPARRIRSRFQRHRLRRARSRRAQSRRRPGHSALCTPGPRSKPGRNARQHRQRCRQLVFVLLPAGHCSSKWSPTTWASRGAPCIGNLRARRRDLQRNRRRRAPGTRGALRRRWRPAAVGGLGAAGLLRTQRVFALVPAKFRR